MIQIKSEINVKKNLFKFSKEKKNFIQAKKEWIIFIENYNTDDYINICLCEIKQRRKYVFIRRSSVSECGHIWHSDGRHLHFAF